MFLKWCVMFWYWNNSVQRVGKKVQIRSLRILKPNKNKLFPRISEFWIYRIQKLLQLWSNWLPKEMLENCRSTLARGWSLARRGSGLPWEQGFPTWMIWPLSRQPRYCGSCFISLNWLRIWMEEPHLWQANKYSMEVWGFYHSSSFQKSFKW